MSKIADISLSRTLTDLHSNLTAGALRRTSDATYIDTSGILQTSWGTRPQKWPTATQDATAVDVSNVTEGAYAWPVSFSTDYGAGVYAYTFGDNSATRTAYDSIALVTGTTYLLSAFVIMDDLSAPTVGATNDLQIMRYRELSLYLVNSVTR